MEQLGLVGLDTSRHDQLFRALTGVDVTSVSDATLGVVALPDERLNQLADMSRSKKRVQASFEIRYVPGLSSEPGKGLGSRLLGSLRDSDAILFLLRSDGIDPADDLAALDYELSLADLASVEGRLERQRRAAKGNTTLGSEIGALEHAAQVLGDGIPVHRSELTPNERELLAPVFLLTNKAVLVVIDVGVNRLDDADALVDKLGVPDGLAVCVELEGDPDVVHTEGDARAELLADLGVSESVIPRLARAALHRLGRRTFLTTGEKESRAWTFRAGAKAPECAGVIHSDLQRGFIRAEVIVWSELLEAGSWSRAKELGRVRVEGKDYEVVDGDVLEIRFNV